MLRIKKNLPIVLLFALIGAYFIFLQWSTTFPDPDSFYHIKMATLMQKDLIIKNFPWIQFADFTNNFTDHHFLYHVLLIPFTFIFPPLLGGKIATTLFALLAIIVFYLFLKKWQIKSPIFFTLILLSSAPFIFRINLAKANVLSIIMLLLLTSLLWRKKYFWLAVLSFIYVWLYDGWIMTLLLIFSFNCALYITQKKIEWLTIISAFFGLVLGMIINPFFPNNFKFYWQHIIQIGVINYKDIIRVGMEWYPYPPLDLFANNIFVFLIIIAAFTLLIFRVIKNQRLNPLNIKNDFTKIFTLFIFASILGLLTIKSQRFVEYFTPFSLLAGIFLFDLLCPQNFSFKDYINTSFKAKNKINLALIIYLLTVFVLFFALNTVNIQKQLTAKYQWNYLENAANWLKKNTPEGSLVFNINWGDWPMLFFHNDHNTYINGLDPTFFYLKNKALYQEWVEIGQGKTKNELAEKIKNNFGAEWILVKSDEIEFLNSLKNKNNFELKFNDAETRIFFIK